MLNRLLDRLATGRGVLLLFTALLIVLVAMNVLATVFAASTGGIGILDLAGGRNALDPRFGGYTPDGAYAMLTAYGPAGRRDHLLMVLADIVLPLALAGFVAAALRYGAKGLSPSRWLRAVCLALPIGYLVADYTENVGIAALLIGYPSRLDPLAATVNIMTSAKSAIAAVALLAAFTAWAVGAVNTRRQSVRIGAPADVPGKTPVQ